MVLGILYYLMIGADKERKVLGNLAGYLADNFYLHTTMSEKTEEKTIHSLLEVLDSVRRTLNERYGSPFWIKAEMNKLNHYVHSGHCYPELLEKRAGKVVAQIRANLWKEDYLRINQQFIRVLKEPLKDGIAILFLARITFDPVYGLALRILEIDPVFSLGELEREKQETIDRLRKEGIFDANKQQPLARVPRRIAVISVESSKGFADFRQMIEENPWGYRVFYLLFPSLLQGDKVTESVGHQLLRIQRVKHHFDAVAIIRGGGGDVGLAGYNRYELARQIALFPLPVLTGIGHATNETVAELVAFRNCITPTELATFLIQQFHNFAVPVKEALQLICRVSRQTLLHGRNELNETSSDFQDATLRFLSLSSRQLLQQAARLKGYSGFLIRGSRQALGREVLMLRDQSAQLSLDQRARVEEFFRQLHQSETRFLQERKQTLFHLEQHVSLLDPRRVLARGYSITRQGGIAIRDAAKINEDDTLETTLYKGTLISTVKKKPRKP